MYLGVGGGDRVGDRLEHGGLARLGRGDDEPALALADRRDQVDDPRGRRRVAVLETEPLIGVDGGQAVEVGAVPGFGRWETIDGLDGEQGLALGGACRCGLALLGLSLLGLILGLLLCVGALRVMSSVIYGVSVYDVPTILTVVLTLGLVTLIATTLPTLRIATIDPAKILRDA